MGVFGLRQGGTISSVALGKVLMSLFNKYCWDESLRSLRSCALSDILQTVTVTDRDLKAQADVDRLTHTHSTVMHASVFLSFKI